MGSGGVRSPWGVASRADLSSAKVLDVLANTVGAYAGAVAAFILRAADDCQTGGGPPMLFDRGVLSSDKVQM